MVAHNVCFDRPFLEDHMRKWNIPILWDYHSLDTVTLAYYKLKPLDSLKLSEIAKKLKIKQAHHHEALDDALTCFEIFKKLMSI
jgi:DNA polymerase III alpha subunit (gram-positive type)